MALPDPVFSHIDLEVTVHQYGTFATRAAKVQDFIYRNLGTPNLDPALEEFYRSIAPAQLAEEFRNAFMIELGELPESEARLLAYFVLTGQLPPAADWGEDPERLRAVTSVCITLALEYLQDPDRRTWVAGLDLLTTVVRRLKLD